MNKKDLKMYEAPASEVVELKINAQILAGSLQDEDTGAENAGAESL